MSVAESKVREILANPLDHNGWVIQGLGMLRLYLGPTQRLHIWDPAKALNSVVSAHDHPWDVDSQIYFGAMGNQRFAMQEAGSIAVQASRVICGIGSHLAGDTRLARITESGPRELYGPGDSYFMRAEELHDSFPEAGTVTVVDCGTRDDRPEVTICWAGGGDWKQEGFTREATREEILHFAGLAALQMQAS